MKFLIAPQRYPTHDGQRPVTYAIWLIRPWRRQLFLGYSWSLEGAQIAMEYIKRGLC